MATFTLTLGLDWFTGIPGQSNIFNFRPTTLSGFDRITGTVSASFSDVLQLTAGGTVTATQFGGFGVGNPGVTNIEQLRLSAAGNAVTLPNSLVAGTSLPGGVFEVVAGAGVDTVNASGVNNGIKIAFYGSGGNDTFIGGTSDDLFLLTPADATAGNTLIGGTGFDAIQLTAGGTVAAAAFTHVTGVDALRLNNAGNNVTLSNALIAGSEMGGFVVVDGTGTDTVDASAAAANTVVTFNGVAGADTYIGGAGTDFFVMPNAGFAQLAGNGGLDRLVFSSAFNNQTFNLTANASKLSNIEIVSLASAANVGMTLVGADIPTVNAAGSLLYIVGGGDDQLNAGSGWVLVSTAHTNAAVAPGVTFVQYHHVASNAELYVANQIALTIGVNDAPAVATSAFAPSFTEDGAPTAVDTGFTVSDDDDTNLESASVSITGGLQAGDVLSFTPQFGIIDTNAAPDILALSGSATLAQWQTVLQSITFSTTSQSPGTSRTVSVTVNDGDTDSAAVAKVIAVTPVTDAPAVATSAFTPSYIEDGAPTAVDTGFTVSDVDDTNLESASVSITGGLQTGDVLGFTPQFGIIDTNAAPEVLALSGSATLAQWETVLSSITFSTTSQSPGTSRTVSVTVNDGDTDSAAVAKVIPVTPVNDAPAVATSAFAPSFTENGAPTAVDTGFTVGDVDDTNLESAIVSITGGLQAGDVLGFTPQFGITDTNAAPDILALSGSATLAQWETVLSSITFSTTSQDPGTSRTVSVTVNDGDTDSAAAAKVIAVTPVDDAPAVATSGFAPSFTEDGAPTAVDTGFTVSDVDDTNLESASVTITGGLQAGDVLGFTPQFGITDTNAAPDILALSGSATLAEWQTVLQSITFSTTNQAPGTSRTVSLTVNDGDTDSAAVAKVIAVTPVNDAPAAATSTFAPSYTEDGAPTAVDTGFTVSDVDDTNLESASVSITGGLQAGDALGFTPQFGITDTNAAPDILALSGSATLAEWQTVLQSITYSTTSQAPGASRTVSITVNDGDTDSAVVTKDITVNPVNDAPAGTDNTVNVTEGTPYTFTAADFGFTDTDANALLAVTITTLPGSGTLTYNDNPVNAGDSIPAADIVAGLLVYTPPAGTGSPSFTFQVQDDGGVANGGVDLDQSPNILTLTIAPPNAAPVANDDASDATEKGGLNNAVAGVDPTGNVVVAAGVGSVTDTDAEDPSTALVVVAVGTGAEGQPDNGTVGSFFSGSYGQLRLMADGSYEYQVNQTNALVQGLHTSADTLTDVFHYTIEDTAGASDDATFTITIHGANDLPQAIADTGSMTEESAATSFPVRANDTLDPDSTAANTISITGTVTATGPAGTTISNGDATAVVSGNDIQVTLNGDFQQLALTETATVTVPYTLTGDAGDTSTANLVVTVNGANDVPIANDDSGSMSENAAATLFDVRSNDTLDVDHTAPNNISIGTVTASGPAGDGITGADVTTAVVGNQVQITLGADFQNLGAGETATIEVPYTLTGDQPGDTDTATLTVTVNGANDAPVAGDFTFNGANAAIGNTALVVNDATDGAPDPVGLQKTITGDLLAGATDVDTPASSLTITAETINNAFGTLIIEADGDFTYLPTAGFTGNAVFSYTLNDNDASGNLTDTGQITIEVATPRVWYVDDSAALGGDGTSDSPFDSLADVSGAAGPDAAGDIIYLFEGNYSGGVTLLDNQTLWGAGTALTVNGTTLAAAGTDPVISNAAGSGVTVEQGNTLTGFTVGNTTGFDITNTATQSVGNLAVSNVTLNGTGGLFRADSGGTLNVQLDSATTSNAGATGIQLVNVDNSIFGVTGVTTINDATTDGIAVSNSQNSTFTFGGLVTILNDAGPANGDGVDLQTNNTADSTFNFNGGVNITVNGAGAFGFRAQSSGTVNILDPAGTNQITSNNGTAILINPTTFNATLNSVTSTGGSEGISLNGMSGSLTIGSVDIDGQTGDGIDITSSAGSVTINGGTIGATNDPAGIGVDVNGGTGNVTISATINKTTAGDVVEVTGRSTGTVDFNGNITSNTAGGGIDINTNTGGTVRFDGGMNLSTGANAAFSSTGGSTGATVVVTDTVSTSNILATTTGTALNVANTTIGSEGLTFQSISSNGAVSGIILNNTGTAAGNGGLTVTGDGNTANNGSGGTIQNSTGPGINLNSTKAVNLDQMNIQNSGDDGIRGSSVAGFTLSQSNVTNNGNAVGERGIDMTELSGSGGISNSTISGSAESNVIISNNTANLTFVVTGSTFATTNFVTGDDGFLALNTGSANMTVSITNSTFTDNKGDHFQAASDADATGAMNITFNNNTLSTTATHDDGLGTDDVIGGGITINTSGSLDITFQINNNNIQEAFDDAININLDPGSLAGASMTGTISGNTIGTSGDRDSGSESSNTITIAAKGQGTLDIDVVNNNIFEWTNAFGIFLQNSEGDATLIAKVTGNTLHTTFPQPFPLNGIQLSAGATAGDSGYTELVLTGNDVTGEGNPAGGDADIRLRQRFDTTVELPGYTGANNDNAAVNAFVSANNDPAGATPAPTVSSINSVASGGGGFIGGTATPLLAADGGVQAALGGASGEHGDFDLSQAELDSAVQAAIGRWADAGASAAQLASLQNLHFTVADLAGQELGSAGSGQIVVDSDAAGQGWFIDRTPFDDIEFGNLISPTQLQTDAGGAPAGDMDLLTVLMHEMGHALGLDHDQADPHNLMSDTLVTGERRLPDASDVAQATDPADAADAANPAEAALPVAAQAPAGSRMVAGADSFVFDHAVLDAPPSTPMPHIADYWAAQGDTFDLSGLVANLPAKLVDALLQVHEDASDAFAALQVNAHSVGGDQHWADAAQFVGVHAGDAVVTGRGDLAQAYADWLL